MVIWIVSHVNVVHAITQKQQHAEECLHNGVEVGDALDAPVATLRNALFHADDDPIP